MGTHVTHVTRERMGPACLRLLPLPLNMPRCEVQYEREGEANLEQAAVGSRARIVTRSVAVAARSCPHKRTEARQLPAVYDVYCMWYSWFPSSVLSAPSVRITLTSPAISYLLMHVHGRVP